MSQRKCPKCGSTRIDGMAVLGGRIEMEAQEEYKMITVIQARHIIL